MAEEDDLDLDVEKKSGGGKKILIFSLIAILVIGASIGTTVALLGGDSEQAEDEEAGDEEGEKKGKKKKAQKKKSKKKKSKSKEPIVPHYTDLEPIVVNLNDPESGVRFLQVAFTVMTTSAAKDEKVKLHMPVIKHHLNLLLSSQKFNSLKTREGKIKLQQDALKAIQSALKEVSDESDLVKQIFIRSIVGQ